MVGAVVGGECAVVVARNRIAGLGRGQVWWCGRLEVGRSERASFVEAVGLAGSKDLIVSRPLADKARARRAVEMQSKATLCRMETGLAAPSTRGQDLAAHMGS
jgi:hypothetical protein